VRCCVEAVVHGWVVGVMGGGCAEDVECGIGGWLMGGIGVEWEEMVGDASRRVKLCGEAACGVSR
jgi:hypothetical protein